MRGDGQAIYRAAARVILLDECERVLLFRVTGLGAGGAVGAVAEKRPLWITPGGGLNPGESFEQAARRELWEETGLEIGELGPMVWRRRHLFTFQDRLLDEDERFFVARCSHFEPHRENFEAHEHTFMIQHRWWFISEIVVSNDCFAPAKMAELLPAVIAGHYPPDPIDTGV